MAVSLTAVMTSLLVLLPASVEGSVMAEFLGASWRAYAITAAVPIATGLAVLYPLTGTLRRVRRAERSWRRAQRDGEPSSWPALSLHELAVGDAARDWVRSQLDEDEYATALVLAHGSEMPLGDLLVVATSLGPDA